MALFFFSHVLACAAPPPGSDPFPNWNIRLCVDTEGREGEGGYCSVLSTGGGGIDALQGASAWGQVQEEAKESRDCLLLITWSPRLSACRCALDYC